MAAQGQFDIVSAILADAGVELGLGVITADFAGTGGDALAAQMTRLLKSTGRRLVLQHPWLRQRVEYTFTAPASTTSYTLPAAFQSGVDLTGWNRTTRQPLVPLSPQRWQEMKATGVSVAMPAYFRAGFTNDAEETASLVDIPKLEFLSAPGDGDIIYLEYRTWYWARPADDPAFLKATPTDATDRCLIDAHLLTRALKLAFLRAKGMDAAAAGEDYQDALDTLRSAHTFFAPVLSLGGARARAHLLDESNIPETGLGT
jgi:hypothetical protein